MIRTVPRFTARIKARGGKMVATPAFKQYGQFSVTVPCSHEGVPDKDFSRVYITHQPSGMYFAFLSYRLAFKVAAICAALFSPFSDADEFRLQFTRLPPEIREWFAVIRKRK